MHGSDEHGRTLRGRWLSEASKILERIAETQLDAIAEAAVVCAGAIEGGGLVHVFGTGHSRIPVEEMFPRYGSYPGFHPIVELSMTFHTQVTGANGQRQAMFIERVEGLADRILANFSFGSGDAMIVYSTSGSTAVPIEMAIGAQERGLPVIAVTSVAHSMASTPRHSSGTRLLDHADIVIDLCTPPGDSLIELSGPETRVGPGSTVANIAIANEIKVQTAALLFERGALPPVLTSSTLVGEERSMELFDAAFREHARRLANVLAKPEEC
ncbi:MAG: SIS domain-containing protein [Actinobacteria bacterium]|nr:SIS domain-containing protein [Actinomycetota bacterium]